MGKLYLKPLEWIFREVYQLPNGKTYIKIDIIPSNQQLHLELEKYEGRRLIKEIEEHI